MLASLKHFFEKLTDDTPRIAADGTDPIRIATCALFLELARIDEQFSPDEVEMILGLLKERYHLSDEHAQALLEEADAERDASVDLWQFANLINQNYSVAEKIDVVETLWQIVFVDGKMDKYERYLMLKIGNLLRLDHDQLIQAKLKVMQRDAQ
ncbi:MAG: TerB family tellurite resistance protein [Desulfosarcinaceae bacterium]|nr:TerB family tellurite resistance protein [Desulfosarcinaceae bacterium]